MQLAQTFTLSPAGRIVTSTCTAFSHRRSRYIDASANFFLGASGWFGVWAWRGCCFGDSEQFTDHLYAMGLLAMDWGFSPTAVGQFLLESRGNAWFRRGHPRDAQSLRTGGPAAELLVWRTDTALLPLSIARQV